MERKTLRKILRPLVDLLSHTEVIGMEYIPTQGAFIIAANHMSRLDVPVAYSVIERDDVTGLAADKYQKYPLIAWIVNLGGGIWLNRESADLSALRAALDHLEAGGALGIAPEGTRSRNGALLAAKNGVAYLADKARVPIIPMALAGTESAVKELLHLRRPHITICIGEPFTLPPVDRHNRMADLQKNTDEIMCRIAMLLPEKYHGAYANHPRLQELCREVVLPKEPTAQPQP